MQWAFFQLQLATDLLVKKDGYQRSRDGQRAVRDVPRKALVDVGRSIAFFSEPGHPRG
jgi:hypothetical protein